MGQSAEVLGAFFSCDSFVALYEFFELFLDEGKLSAIDFIECQNGSHANKDLSKRPI